MAQGLIQTMQHADFRTDYPAAHSAADAGGDFAFARFADFAIAEPTWDVPTADLIAIYASLNYSVSAPQLRACMAEGYAAVQANRIAGRLLFPAWAAQSPFLAERYFDYFRGGVDDMALWTADCWTRVVTWLDRGYWAWNDTCVNMGASWRPGPPPGPGDGPDDQYGAPGNDDDSPFPDIRKPRIPVPLPPSDAPPLPVPSSSHNRPASFANPDFLDLNSVRSCLRVAISDDLASSDHSGDLIQSPLVAALTAGPALLAAPWAARILLRCAPGLSGDLQIETRFSTPPAPRTVNALAALAASTNEPGLPPADPQQPEVPGPQHPDNPSRPARPKDRGEPSSWPRWVLRLENVITLVSRLSRAASGQISTVFQRWFGDGCTKVVSGGKGVLALIETAADYAALGAALAVGDFDGDGLPDLVVGAPRHTSPGVPHAGRAYIFYGRDGLPRSGLAESTASAVVELPASDPRTRGARLATSLAVVDLNRDGIDDLALAAPAFGSHANNWTAAYDGRVIVLFGSKTKGIDTNTSNAGLVIDGVVVRGAPPSRNPGKRARKGDSDQFLMLGEALSGLDVDADGFVDLVIGSPSASAVRGTHQRGLLQAFLAASNHSGPLPHTAADWTIAGSQDFSWFGASAALVPLPPQAVLPGTSSSLLVVGSPGYRHNATIARSNGRISGFRIPLRPSTPSNAEISPRPSLVFTLESRVDLANFGAGLVARGDGLLYVAAPAEASSRATPRFMNLPGILIPGDMMGYQAGVVRLINITDLEGTNVLVDGSDSVPPGVPLNITVQAAAAIHGSGSLGHLGAEMHAVRAGRSDMLVMSEYMVEAESGRVVAHVLTDPRSLSELSTTHLAAKAGSQKCWTGGRARMQFGRRMVAVPGVGLAVSGVHADPGSQTVPAGMHDLGISRGEVFIVEMPGV